jgi:hypothetical protein
MTATYRPGMSPATFVAGEIGPWRIDAIKAINGESLTAAPRLQVREGIVNAGPGAWSLRAVSGHVRSA